MSTPQLLEIRRNIRADLDQVGRKLNVMCDVVLVVASPTYRVDAAGRVVQEYTTSDLRFQVGLDGLQHFIDSLSAFQAEAEGFAKSVRLDRDKFERHGAEFRAEVDKQIAAREAKRKADRARRRAERAETPEQEEA